eukprot:scaffold7938_cov1035-Prasinococcus_capsulatus_cf.AAC.2
MSGENHKLGWRGVAVPSACPLPYTRAVRSDPNRPGKGQRKRVPVLRLPRGKFPRDLRTGRLTGGG